MFKIKDLGEIKYFFGIEIARSKHGIFMNQKKYTMELITELGLAGSKTGTTPMEFNQKLTSVKLDDQIGIKGDEKLDEEGPCKRLIGKILNLTMNRPDISYAIHTFSQFMHYPKKSHMETALRIVRCIKNAPALSVLMSSKKTKKLRGFSDAAGQHDLCQEDQ